MKLKALIIHKNDATYLGGCLVSLKKKVDEVIVGDTGSYEQNKDKAEKLCGVFGARFETISPFIGFGTARNEMLSFLDEGDWFLQIDCDERLDGGKSLKAFIEDLYNPEVRGLSMRLFGPHYKTSGDNYFFDELVTRIYRYERGMKYNFEIHESVLPFLREKGYKVEFFGAGRLVHLGYAESPQKTIAKAQRNKLMLTKELDKEFRPHERGYLLYMLAQTQIFLGEYAEGLKSLGAAITLVDDQGIYMKIERLIRQTKGVLNEGRSKSHQVGH